MSGNQQPQISLPTWRCGDFNAAIPIKKRKYFVLPEEPGGGSSPPLENNSDKRLALDSSNAHVNQKMIGEGSRKIIGDYADKTENIGNQVRVKVEEPKIPIHSSPFSGSLIPSSSLHCSLEKLPCDVVTSELNVEQTVLKIHDIVSNETLRGECQTEVSAGAGNVSLWPSCKPKNSSNEELSALNFSLSEGVCAPLVTDSVSTCTKSGNLSGVNRSNWDLNTTMDAWEDGLDHKTRVKTTGSFFDSNNRSFPEVETSSCGDTTVIAKPVSEILKENVEVKSPTMTSTQVNPTCLLSLGLSSHPPIEKSPSLSVSTLEASVACTNFPRPIMTAGNVNPVNLRTVKSEVVEGISVNRVKQEVVGSLNPVDSVSIKAEPQNLAQSEGFNRRDGTLNHPGRPIMQSDEILGLPTSCKDANKPYPDSTLKENSGKSSGHRVDHKTNACYGHGEHKLNASDLKVSMTEDKILDDCSKASPGTKELSGEEKVILSGKELHGYEFETDCGNDLSSVLKKHVEKGNLYDNEKVQRSAAKTEQRNISVPYDGDNQNYDHGKTGDNEGRIVQDVEQTAHQTIHGSEGMSGVSTTLSGGKVDNISPASYKAEISTVDNDPPVEFSEGSSQSRIKTLEASDSFVPSRMERDRLLDFSLDQRKYLSRGSDDDSYKFSRERYHGKTMRSPRLNFMPDRRRFSDNTERNLHDQDTKNFESSNYGNTRRGGAFMSSSYRGRRHANDEAAPFPHTFTRRTFTQRGSTDKEDASAYGEKFTRGGQSNDMEAMFMNHQPRPYQGRNSFARGGRTNFSNSYKRGYSGYRSRSPIRSRERSAGPSSSFRNRSQEDFSGHNNPDFFSHRRSPSGYRMGRISSPEHSGCQRERHNSSQPYSHRPSNAGRGRGYRGYERGRGYARGRGYGRDGISFRKPYDRVGHRNHGNFNNFDPRERVDDYSDDFFEGPIHSERFGVGDNVERRQFGGYRHDGTSSFRQSFNSDGCAPSNIEDGFDDERYGQDPDFEMVKEQGILKEIDGKDKTSTEIASGRSKNMEEEETSKYSEIWQGGELGGDGF